MLKKENCVLNIDINNWARPCNNCRSAACTVYCRADSAYLCTGCDARIHAASHHERVYVCEACERAPAAFLCKADSASLCATCDAEIHSANPLARRHIRVPILPILNGSLVEPLVDHDHDSVFETIDEEDEDEAASWLLLNPVKNNNNNNNNGGFFAYGGESMDEYLDLVDYSTCQDSRYEDRQQIYNHGYSPKGFGEDSVVPVQNEMKSQVQLEHRSYQFGIEYDTLKTQYDYPASINHNVSVSSMDVGVVPESTTSDVSISHTRPSKGTIELFSTPPIQVPTQLTPMDREARVLRYREKKKTRKFEKTIRYASRKAYAETRPRIKGRFAKRTNLDVEVDQMFSSEGGYGIVPSY